MRLRAVGTAVILLLRLGKLGLREVRPPPQGYTARWEQRWGLNPIRPGSGRMDQCRVTLRAAFLPFPFFSAASLLDQN